MSALAANGQHRFEGVKRGAVSGREYHSDVPAIAKPWPRFWARFLDIQLYGWPVAIVLVVLFPNFFSSEAFQGRQGDILIGLISLPFALAIDAVILSTTGSSVGKGLAGIFLATTYGTRLSLDQAFVRNAHLYARGMVLGIPILALFGYGVAFNDLRDNQSTAWDRETDSRIYATSVEPSRTWAVAFIGIALYAVGNTLSRMSESGTL